MNGGRAEKKNSQRKSRIELNTKSITLSGNWDNAGLFFGKMKMCVFFKFG